MEEGAKTDAIGAAVSPIRRPSREAPSGDKSDQSAQLISEFLLIERQVGLAACAHYLPFQQIEPTTERSSQLQCSILTRRSEEAPERPPEEPPGPRPSRRLLFDQLIDVTANLEERGPPAAEPARRPSQEDLRVDQTLQSRKIVPVQQPSYPQSVASSIKESLFDSGAEPLLQPRPRLARCASIEPRPPSPADRLARAAAPDARADSLRRPRLNSHESIYHVWASQNEARRPEPPGPAALPRGHPPRAKPASDPTFDLTRIAVRPAALKKSPALRKHAAPRPPAEPLRPRRFKKLASPKAAEPPRPRLAAKPPRRDKPSPLLYKPSAQLFAKRGSAHHGPVFERGSRSLNSLKSVQSDSRRSPTPEHIIRALNANFNFREFDARFARVERAARDDVRALEHSLHCFAHRAARPASSLLAAKAPPRPRLLCSQIRENVRAASQEEDADSNYVFVREGATFHFQPKLVDFASHLHAGKKEEDKQREELLADVTC